MSQYRGLRLGGGVAAASRVAGSGKQRMPAPQKIKAKPGKGPSLQAKSLPLPPQKGMVPSVSLVSPAQMLPDAALSWQARSRWARAPIGAPGSTSSQSPSPSLARAQMTQVHLFAATRWLIVSAFLCSLPQALLRQPVATSVLP